MDKELGVREDSPGVTTFSEDFLLILSLVSEDARGKAETGRPLIWTPGITGARRFGKR